MLPFRLGDQLRFFLSRRAPFGVLSGLGRIWVSLALTVLWSGLLSQVAAGQEAAKDPAQPALVSATPAEAVDATSINAAIAQLQSNTDLDEATRTAAIQLYQTALKRLETRDQAARKIAEYDQAVQSAAQTLEETRRELQQLANTRPTIPFGLPASQLEQRRVQLQTEIENQRKRFDQLTDEPNRRRNRIAELPAAVQGTQTQLAQVKAQLDTAAPPGEKAEVTRARRTQLLAQQLALQAELDRLNREQLFYTATADLLPEQRALAKQQLDDSLLLLETIQRTINQQQESTLQRFSRETAELQKTVPTPLRALAENNAALVESYRQLLDQNTQNLMRLKEVRTTAESVDSQYRASTERVKAVGLTDALGVMLKQQRRELEELLVKYQPDPQLKEEARKLQVMSFDLQDKLNGWLNDEQTAAAEWERLDVEETLREQLLPQLKQLVNQRRLIAQEMSQANNQTFQNLIALDTEQHKLASRIGEFTRFVDQHVIWIPSAPVFTRGDWRHVLDATRWLVSPKNWSAVLREPPRDLQQYPLIYLPLILSLIFLFIFHRRLKRIIFDTGEQARRVSCAAIAPTLNSLLATFLMASLWPMVFAVLGWMLIVNFERNEFVSASGHAALSVALFVAPLELLRHVCRQHGLADAHFAWSERVRRFFGQNVKVFYILAAPLLVVVIMLDNQENEHWSNSVGRLAALALFVLVAYFLHLTLRSQGVIFQQMAIRNSQSQMYKLRQFWYLLVVGIPVFLLIAAMSGYYYTAIQLGACLQNSVTLAIAVIVTGEVIRRWLLVRRRQVSIEEFRKQRELLLSAATPFGDSTVRASEQSATATNATAVGAAGPFAPSGLGFDSAALALQEQPNLDLATVSRQAREIVVFALGAVTIGLLWWIWRDVLPAFGMLDRVTLWSVSLGERVESVTLKSVFYALVVFLTTFLFVKNMSGVLNLFFLEYSSMDAGARYAATTIFRYLFIVIGAIAALSFLHIPWSQYGWLVAAVTVGLGFGLQEIVANFVSGLILLFERPVRVGDVVTIEGTTGVVTRIQMRATTVTNWDHQELIVPNKEFITGKLLNWTLSSQINRLVLNVGVAYGTDPNRVRDLLLETVSRHPDILKDPAPAVNLDTFGESSLNFVVRCFLANLDRRLQVKHELNTAITQALRSNGISIPFPHREIHIVDDRLKP
ncbi:MAG: mechanosensitive ion channel domain-containing protein [Planctomycetota bacterium]|jgi:potassium efflux system protein